MDLLYMDANYSNFNPLYLILGIILGVLILSIESIFRYKKVKAKIMEENFHRIANSSSFVSCVLEYIKRNEFIKNILENNTTSPDLFKDMAKASLENSFSIDYEKHIEYIPGTTLENPLTYLYKFPYFPTFESKQKVFSETIRTNKMIDVVLLNMYIEHVEKNIKELEEEENEYREFIKKLGADKEGYDNYDYEKLFRPRDTSDDIKDNEDIDNEVNLDKLVSIGTVEEFDDNLKEF